MILGVLLLLGLAGAPAASPDPPWYIGQPVGLVSLEAVDGGLPGENLEPLLTVQQGDPLDPYAVRGDLAMLQRVGQFAAVEAHVEPWVGADALGEPVEAVRLVYRVRPPPRVRRLRVEGARALGHREVEAASALGPGDPFHEAQDVAVVTDRLRAFYARSGFPDARVEVVPRPVDGRRLDLDIRVAEGPPELLGEVYFVGLPEGLERAARRALRRAGLREGRRFERGDVPGARDALEALLRRRGFQEADVDWREAPGGPGAPTRLSLSVRAGRRVEVAVEGTGLATRRALARIAREQLAGPASEEIIAEASASLAAELQRRGWGEAQVAVTVDEQGPGRRVRVLADRGPRHVLAETRFPGAGTFDDRYLSDALREASPDVLGRGRVTEDELARALQQVVEFYRSQGFLDARLTLEALEEGPPRGGRVPVTVTVRVEEGPRTVLAAMDLEGEPCPGAQDVLDGASGLVGAPLDPSAMDRLARAVAEACWDEGFLDADVAVRRELSPGGGAARIAFTVEPGPLVVLRNVIIQGQRHTRRRVIEDEVEPETGEPITRTGMIETRKGLYDLGLFRRVETELLGDEDRVKDLLVDVQELPRLAFEAGGGGSTDQGVRAFLRATHRNLWGTAHRLAALGQAGLGYQGESWRLDATRPEWRVGLRYEAPNVPGEGQRSFLDAVLNEEQQHGTFRLSRSGGALGVRAAVGAHGELSMDYRLEWRRLEDVDPGALIEADPWLPLLGLPSSPVGPGEPFDPSAWGEPDLPSASRICSGPGFLLVSDARDDPENPRRGLRWTLQARIEDGVLSAVPFVVARTQVQALLPLGPIGLLLGLQAGLGQALEVGATLPLEERFALGGAGSLRGFQRETVGPRNRISAYDPGYPEQISPLLEALRESDPYRWVSTGGDAMAVGTVEIKVPMPLIGLRAWPDAALVAFTDAGNAFLLGGLAETTTTQLGGEPALRTGVGVGFRYTTAVGPLQLDLGFNPWYNAERDEVPVRVHLSLGSL